MVDAGFHMQSGGKIPAPVCARADAWLRKAIPLTPHAVIALPQPTEAEVRKQAVYRKRK